MMETEDITATLIEDPEPSIPPGFGPFAAIALQEIQNDVKPADVHSSSVQVVQSIDDEGKDEVEILECVSSLSNRRHDITCSTSLGETCRKSLRNRPPIDYSRFDHIADGDSDVEVAEKVNTHLYFDPYFSSYLNFIKVLMYMYNTCSFFLRV
jgi:hypothetical protein